MANDPHVNAIDMNSPGLDYTPGATKRRRWDPGTNGPGQLTMAVTDYTITTESGPEGYILFTANAATVRIPPFAAAPFKPDMQVMVATDRQTKAITLTPDPAVRLVVDDDPILRSLAIGARSFLFTGTSNGFGIRNLGRDLWLLMRSDRPAHEYDGQEDRWAANTAAGLPWWWPRD